MPSPGRQPIPRSNQVILKFGSGINSRASESEIDPSECADGQNFDLDIENTLFARRKPFDLVATATNAEQVRGFAQLETQNGVLTTLVQAGNTVYQWDGASSFTSVGTVPAAARLRGPRATHNFTIDDVVIITDLSLESPVLQWNGTTLSEIQHGLGGSFKARYVQVEKERAIYANVQSGSATPHLVVVSALDDYDNLSVSNRPSTALSEADPFFLVAPDLKPINGLVAAFGLVAISTRKGRIYKISGQSAQDFAVEELYADSGATGDEALAYIGNDIAYGRVGRLESLFATDALGDVETDDLSRKIQDLTETVSDWLVAYDSVRQRVLFFDRNNSRVFVFHKSFLDDRVAAIAQRRQVDSRSPWSLWRTGHSSAFQPQVAMPLVDSATGRETIFFGGNSGEIFRIDGSGGQDGGTADITVSRTSSVFRPEVPGTVFRFTGTIRYRRIFPATVTLTFLYGGEALLDESVTVSIPQAAGLPVYGGGLYYSGGSHYSAPFSGRFSIKDFDAAGHASEFQLKVEVSGSTDFFIEEVEINFGSA